MRVPKFLLPAPKNWILGPKKAKFGPFDLMSDQKTMPTSCVCGFLLCWYQNFYSLPPKIGFWAQKRPNLAQNWHFGPNIGIFAPFDLKPDQKTMQTSCLDGFLLCWYQNFYLLPKELGFLTQKRPNLAKNWHFWPNMGIFGPFNPMPDLKTIRTSCLGGFSVM